MFEFFKQFDEDIYIEIVDEVEFNMWNDRCISIIKSEIEKIIKKLFRESDIVIMNVGDDGVMYREYNPTLANLLNDNNFRKYLDNNKLLTYKEIEKYWKIIPARNDKEHGPKFNREKINITLSMKKDALKYLFNLCYNVYWFNFGKKPDEKWDDEYFKKLLKKPEERVIEKEIKVIDNVELDKIKKKNLIFLKSTEAFVKRVLSLMRL